MADLVSQTPENEAQIALADTTDEPMDMPEKTTEDGKNSTAAPSTDVSKAEGGQTESAAGGSAAAPPSTAATGNSVHSTNDMGKKENEEASHNPLQSIPTRQYLDQTVVPILLQALGALAKERPSDPIDFVANYLLKEKSRFVQENPS
ncbi:dpy-30 motif domain-containing protein [Ditylenchus destructor]|uniref:Protein dpy-30 homolog n=1 Tax=Ditylenchus destructor TaxID=166010 RepID=A0AAD4N6Y8_9BILA|nr:dpy-30 motif domain-containing protein [Ditylenchus destructor]